MNILPVVVLYNVDFRRTNAYRTLLCAYKGRILLYENSPEPMNRAYMSQTVLYRHDATNGGVSAAYNYAAMMAKRMGQVDALLLLDEDTSFERDYIQTLQQAMTDRPAVSLFVPQVVYRVNRPFSPIVRSALRWHRGAKLAPGVYSLNRYLPVNSGACIRLAAFERVKAGVIESRPYVRPELKDAFFAAIEYPVYAAAAMSRKMLTDSAESHRAYEEIQSLTRQYNETNGGKWRGLMDAAPRRLPVFEDVHGVLKPCREETVLQVRASAFETATEGAAPVQMLGRSMNAVRVPKGGQLTYRFAVDSEGDYLLRTALIPMQPVDDGDIRYSVSLDDAKPTVYSLKEPFRSEEWKRNVLRGQTLRDLPVRLSAGSHSLTIRALDEHIVVDQWKLIKLQ